MSAQAPRRSENSGTAAPTSTISSAGTFARRAAARIASGEGASYRQYVRRRSALRNENSQRTPSSALTSSIKQGGIAAQEAEAVAKAIAADAGAQVQPSPCRPVLRGLLLTGFVPRFLRHEEYGPSLVDTQPLWWPPGKIVGRYLSPFLAEHLGLAAEPAAVPADALPIEVAVDRPAWTPV